MNEAASTIEAFFDREFGMLSFSDRRLPEAMRYALTGGKRLRGFLVLEGARLHGVSPRTAIFPAAAIEAMHAYSLVHDDLPCMDDDDMRRGRPTVHVQWDEGTAVLAGDALQSLAFSFITRSDIGMPDVVGVLAGSLAHASGIHGMVMGQALDIAAESATEPLALDEVTALQGLKTGALIEWAGMAGPRLAMADPTAMQRYSSDLGVAFQIADDILDVEGNASTLGKATGKDAGANKATFVSLLGLDGAKARADELVESACDALSPYGDEAETLRALARFVISRDS